jgi:ribose transport system permease protein
MTETINVEETTATQVSAVPSTRRQRFDRERLLLVGESYGLVALLGLVVLFFSIWGKTSAVFPTSANLNAVVGNQAVLAVTALAAIIPLIAGQFDLSVGATVGLSSVVSAKLMADTGLPLAACGVAAVATGAGIGLVNAIIVARLGINSLISTLGLSTVLGGVAVAIAGNAPIVQGISNSLVNFGTGEFLGLPNTLFVLAVAALLVWYLLEHTPFGRYLHAIGSNREAARLVGIGVDRLVFRSFLLTGTIAGAAGFLQLARTGSGDPTIGVNFTLPALAAAFLGATAIRPGRFNVGGTLVAIFFLAAAVSGLTLAGAQGYVQDLFNGSALIAGVAVSTLIARQRLRGRKAA